MIICDAPGWRRGRSDLFPRAAPGRYPRRTLRPARWRWPVSRRHAPAPRPARWWGRRRQFPPPVSLLRNPRRRSPNRNAPVEAYWAAFCPPEPGHEAQPATNQRAARSGPNRSRPSRQINSRSGAAAAGSWLNCFTTGRISIRNTRRRRIKRRRRRRCWPRDDETIMRGIPSALGDDVGRLLLGQSSTAAEQFVRKS